MARMIKLVHAVPELMILLKGIAMAARSVLSCLCLLFVLIYAFGVGMTNLCRDTDVSKVYFSTVPHSMSTLLLYACFAEDLPDLVIAAGSESYLYATVLVIFVLLAYVTVMHMLMGMLVEVVSVVAAMEKETLAVNYVKLKLSNILAELDQDRDDRISKDELKSLLYNKEALKVLREVDVDVIGLVDFADFIFEDKDDLSFPEFMTTLLQFRGTNKATVKDIVDLRKFTSDCMKRVESLLLLGGDGSRWPNCVDETDLCRGRSLHEDDRVVMFSGQ